jgi:hypothetical protein
MLDIAPVCSACVHARKTVRVWSCPGCRMRLKTTSRAATRIETDGSWFGMRTTGDNVTLRLQPGMISRETPQKVSSRVDV